MINRIHRRFIRGAVLAALMFSQAMPAQSPSPSSDATLHVNSTEVLVDAVVTDKKGNIPRDLTAQNFKILEDGQEQKITSFSFSGSGEPGRRAKRFMALVFDDDLPGFREAARRFVEENAGAGSLHCRVCEDGEKGSRRAAFHEQRRSNPGCTEHHADRPVEGRSLRGKEFAGQSAYGTCGPGGRGNCSNSWPEGDGIVLWSLSRYRGHDNSA